MPKATDGSAEMACNVTFGPGKSVDVEYRGEAGAWISLGSAVESGDLWLSGEGEIPDIRIRVLRSKNEIRIIADRGGQSSVWWPQGGAPMLTVLFDPSGRKATAAASAGLETDFQEVRLGQQAY